MKNITSTSTFSQSVKQIKANYSKDSGVPLGTQISAKAHEKKVVQDVGSSYGAIKKQNNTAILQSSMEASVSAGNEPLSLLYKVAIDNINEVLKPELGKDAIQAAYDSGLDVTPEATADRIVSLSTAFFSQYQEQNQHLSTEDSVKSFVKVIGAGIDKGFAEAKEILQGLKVLDGDIAGNIDVTYDLVQKGLQSFINSYTQSTTEQSS